MFYFLIALGGATGALTRFGISGLAERWFAPGFPVGTMVANVTGCFFAGVLIGSGVANRTHWSRAHLGIGFLGSMTTFSTFSTETVDLIEQQQWTNAGLNVVLSLFVGLLAVACGLYAGRKLSSNAG